jgi:hypothetical protein
MTFLVREYDCIGCGSPDLHVSTHDTLAGARDEVRRAIGGPIDHLRWRGEWDDLEIGETGVESYNSSMEEGCGGYDIIDMMDDPADVASEMGAEYCRQIVADWYHCQDGPGRLERGEDIPDDDHRELALMFPDMYDENGDAWDRLVQSYRDGYNAESDE